MKTALEVLDAIKKGEATVYDVVSAFLETIEEKESIHNAFINVYPEEALERAVRLDEDRPDELPPLYGLPVAVKDNIAVKGMELTCASRILLGFESPYSATVIKRLESAGAIVLGKTNMDEFAMGSTNENSYFGPARNAIDPDYVAGGSSGGSAVSVALWEAPVSLGSDTGGSIRQPAAFNGIVGLKPTYGRVSRYGLVAFASSLDQIGPMGRTVEDVALVYSVIAGYDPRDSTSADVSVEPFSEYLADPEGMSIGIDRRILREADEGIVRGFEEVVEFLKSAGYRIVEVEIPYFEYSVPVYHIIASSEASSNLARYDGVRYGYRAEADNLDEMYYRTRTEGFGEEVKRRILVGTFSLSYGYKNEFYLRASRIRRLMKEGVMKLFDEVDVILTPAVPVFPWKLGEHPDLIGKVYKADYYTIFANLTGIPALSIPVGGEKFPVSVQLMGRYFDEKSLFRLGRRIFHAFNIL